MNPNTTVSRWNVLIVILALSIALLPVRSVLAQSPMGETVVSVYAPAACEPLPLGATPDSMARAVFQAFNQWRLAHGLLQVAWNNLLASIALAHSQEMSQNNYFSHTGLNGSTEGTRALAAGYDYEEIGETLAAGQSTAAAVIIEWENSPTHLHVMKMPLREVGIGYVYDPNDQANVRWPNGFVGGPYCHYWTLLGGDRSQVFPVIINVGAATTSSRNVQVTIAYGNASTASQIPQVRFATQPMTPAQWNSVPWVTFTGQQISLELPAGSGIKTVYGQVNWYGILPTEAISATIRLEQTPLKRVYLPRELVKR